MTFLTITVWKVSLGMVVRPAEAVFCSWDLFWEYVNDCKIQENYTMVFKPFSWKINESGEKQVSPKKNFGFWTVDLYEK